MKIEGLSIFFQKRELFSYIYIYESINNDNLTAHQRIILDGYIENNQRLNYSFLRKISNYDHPDL